MSSDAQPTLKSSSNSAVLLVKLPKKKAKYSKKRRTRLELENAVLIGVRRLTKALDKGVGTYIDEREQSAASGKDGAHHDSLRNAARGLRVFNSHAAEAPADFLEAVSEMKATKRIFRKLK